MKSYFTRVYEVVRQIPRGRVCTYGCIAAYLGGKGGARMVGWALNQSKTVNPEVPAHRVVNKKGYLTGRLHFSSPQLMEKLLENEGVTIKNHQVQNMGQHFWDPLLMESNNKPTPP